MKQLAVLEWCGECQGSQAELEEGVEECHDRSCEVDYLFAVSAVVAAAAVSVWVWWQRVGGSVQGSRISR